MEIYQLKDILTSLHDDVTSGEMTLREAAKELHNAGWLNFIDITRTKQLLKL